MKGVVHQVKDFETLLLEFPFQREGPFPNERKGELFEIVNEVMDYAIRYFDGFLIHHLERNLSSYSKSKGKRKIEFKHHLFWWIVFCQPLDDRKTTIFQEFIRQTWSRWKFDPTLLYVIASWVNIQPGFYLIMEVISDHDLIVKDLLNGEVKPVSVYNENFKIPQQDDLLTGLLLSYCDGTYSPIFDFLVIPSPFTTRFTQNLVNEFNKVENLSFASFLRVSYGDMLAFLIPYLTSDL